ncbi:MAG: hypothetical protein Roseis2KO_13170 [Roseivirga sp.]
MAMDKKIPLMVASTVYGYQDQLSAINATIETLGNYRIVNSHKGTVKVDPTKSNMDNCLQAVRDCDVFLGIIRPYYGTGNIGDQNITFEEMKLAIELKKPYWFLVHRDVTFARQLLNKAYCRDRPEERQKNIYIKKSPLFDSRTLDVYDYVIKHGKPVTLRTGNWAQEYWRLSEALEYVITQFEDEQFVRDIVVRRKAEQ